MTSTTYISLSLWLSISKSGNFSAIGWGMELVGKVEKVLTYMLSVIRNIIYDARDV